MEPRPDGRAVSVCEPSARSCEHQHVPLGVPPIPWLLPWLEPTRPKGGGGGKKHKHSSRAFPMYFMFSSPSLPFSIIYIHGKDIEESDNRSHDSPSQPTWGGAPNLPPNAPPRPLARPLRTSTALRCLCTVSHSISAHSQLRSVRPLPASGTAAGSAPARRGFCAPEESRCSCTMV